MSNKKSLHQQIKLIPIYLLIFITLSLCMHIFASFAAIGKTKILAVDAQHLKARTYHRVKIGENSFQTGTEGRLHWKVKDLEEAFLVGLANQEGVLNYYDLFYFLILDIALFIMLAKVSEERVFTAQLIFGLYLISYSIIFYAFIVLLGQFISGWSIERLTHGMFTSQSSTLNISKYLFLAFLLFFMVPLVRKGIELQNENELTI